MSALIQDQKLQVIQQKLRELQEWEASLKQPKSHRSFEPQELEKKERAFGAAKEHYQKSHSKSKKEELIKINPIFNVEGHLANFICANNPERCRAYYIQLESAIRLHTEQNPNLDSGLKGHFQEMTRLVHTGLAVLESSKVRQEETAQNHNLPQIFEGIKHAKEQLKREEDYIKKAPTPLGAYGLFAHQTKSADEPRALQTDEPSQPIIEGH